MTDLRIEPMTAEDIPAAIELWRRTPGVVLRDADSPERLLTYLGRNPGNSFVAKVGGELIGIVLGGHDSRRGALQHMAVDVPYRRRGIGRKLVEAATKSLLAIGIEKCFLFVTKTNRDGLEFWRRIGWQTRDDLELMTITLTSNDNA